jgi:hypothetical protein
MDIKPHPQSHFSLSSPSQRALHTREPPIIFTYIYRCQVPLNVIKSSSHSAFLPLHSPPFPLRPLQYDHRYRRAPQDTVCAGVGCIYHAPVDAHARFSRSQTSRVNEWWCNAVCSDYGPELWSPDTRRYQYVPVFRPALGWSVDCFVFATSCPASPLYEDLALLPGRPDCQ